MHHQTRLLHEIEQLKVKLEVTTKAVVNMPDLRALNLGCIHAAGDIGANAPHDYRLMAEHRKQLEQAGWIWIEEYRYTECGTLHQRYRFENVMLTIYYRPDQEGATCQVRHIGTEPPRPIVEVICTEA